MLNFMRSLSHCENQYQSVTLPPQTMVNKRVSGSRAVPGELFGKQRHDNWEKMVVYSEFTTIIGSTLRHISPSCSEPDSIPQLM